MTCDGYPGEITTGDLDDFRPLNDDIYVGMRVLVLYEGTWYSGEALEEVEDCHWEVQCDDDQDGEITTSSDVRPEDSDDMYSSSSSDDDASRQQWLQDDVDDVARRYKESAIAIRRPLPYTESEPGRVDPDDFGADDLEWRVRHLTL